jgi:hypothetical protein
MKMHPIPRTIIRFARRLHHIVPAAIGHFLHHVFCPHTLKQT